ncbi:MAG: amphi-Trp domain-containing protein [Candidatus Rokubacteria bacterium]|nr:amphi-Trp domain-containing protein [Candidatus Rokubacteria bacterium]
MAKDRFEFSRTGSPEEIAEYLLSLAAGLKRGEIGLESGERTMRLVPGPEVRVTLDLRQKERRGKLAIEVGWKRGFPTRTSGLQISVGSRST